MKNELERFIETWEKESAKTIKLLEVLPKDGYDFRPDPEGRSLGELAWHLAEPEAYGSFAIERGGFSRDVRPPGIERPRTIAELAPGLARVHNIHHRGQLAMMCRLAGGKPTSLFGPTREDLPLPKRSAEAQRP